MLQWWNLVLWMVKRESIPLLSEIIISLLDHLSHQKTRKLGPLNFIRQLFSLPPNWERAGKSCTALFYRPKGT